MKHELQLKDFNLFEVFTYVAMTENITEIECKELALLIWFYSNENYIDD